ncbi:MltF family protein [Fulvivirga lutea]|uniref:Transporter substrate-binding domain-containing protein n=1 Tax=Fulvivirga lutea TaxID=2810512 RepID=A0A975A0M1_9BACT|nr:transporter substrate-binding domain-containing protein [Fulvivirga lutea]QSE97539.1 transporter substrate-binding domain-containing protein [Fulvivirga lutea]
MGSYAQKYLIILFLYFIGCTPSGQESDKLSSRDKSAVNPVKFDLDKIKKRGSIIAIVDNSSTGYFIYKGQPMGYEYELLKKYADEQKLRLDTRLITSIDQAFEMLNKGEGDIIAFSLTVTKERKDIVAFTDYHFTTRQVLVQKKPDNWREITKDETEDALIRNQVNLIGKQVNVRKGSAYIERLKNLSNEIGGDIIIVEEPDTVETEGIIREVSKGNVEYTVADEMVADVNAAYYPNIDVKTPISFPQQIAWAVRKNSPKLLESVNKWLKKIKKKPTFNVIYRKYYNSPRSSLLRVKSEFSSSGGGKISPYDELVKDAATKLDWDWKLIVAQMYRESRFDPKAKSWAGAYGLMQLIPETGRRYGARNMFDPEQNINAAISYMDYLDSLWAKTIDDKRVRQKFVLASYNVGLGHVEDARNLAEKYDHDPTQWEGNVAKYLRLKSNKEYFTDPIVTSGYCRGDEPVNYVRDIFNYYEQYNQLIGS